MDWKALSGRFSERRQCGSVVAQGMRWASPPNEDQITAWLRDIGIQCGYGLPEIELTADQASALVRNLFRIDIAYGEILPSANIAPLLARIFFDTIPDESRFYTNSSYILYIDEPPYLNHRGEWTPLTDHTFDAGVIAIHPRQTEIIWFMDED